MARVDATGAEVGANFELDSVSQGSGGTFASSTLQARSGSRSWRALRSGAVVASEVLGQITFASARLAGMVYGALLIPASIGNVSERVLTINFGTNEHISLSMTRSSASLTINTLYTLGGSNGGFTDSTYFNTPYWIPFCIAWSVVTGGGVVANDTLTSYIGSLGNVFTTTTHITNLSGANNVQFGLGVGGATSAQNNEIFFDDLVLDDAAGDLIPPWTHLVFERPQSDNGAQAWTPVGAGASNAARVSDQADGTGVQRTGPSNGASDFDLYDLTDPPQKVPAVKAVTLYASTRDSLPTGQTPGTYELSLRYLSADNFPTTILTSATPTTRRSILHAAIGNPTNGLMSAVGVSGLFKLRLPATGNTATTGVLVLEGWVYYEIIMAVSAADTGTIAENAEVRARAEITDALVATETLEIRAKSALVDSAASVEALEIRAKSALSDSGTIADSAEVRAKVALDDSGTSVELPEIRTRTALSDSGAAVEAIEVRAKTALDDFGAAVDAAEQLKLVPESEAGVKKIFPIFDD